MNNNYTLVYFGATLLITLVFFVHVLPCGCTQEGWTQEDDDEHIGKHKSSHFDEQKKQLSNKFAAADSVKGGSSSSLSSSSEEEEEEIKLTDEVDGTPSSSSSGDTSPPSQPSDYELEKNSRLENEHIKSVHSAKMIQLNMANIVRDMRSKAMNKVYKSFEKQKPLEQSFDDALGSDEKSGDNIQIAVKSKRKFEFVPVHFDRDNMKMPQMIEIVSDTMPLRLHFKSQSAAIVVTQSHMSPPMKPLEETVTMDEPYRLSHEVYKPIIQEVKEIIQPYRNIVQQVKPVIEDIRTIVPKDNDIGHHHHWSAQQRQQTKMSTNTNDWNISSPGKKHLRPPPPTPKPSPATQLHGKFKSLLPSSNSYSGSESVKILNKSKTQFQRRMQWVDGNGSSFKQTRQTVPYSTNGVKYGDNLQFGSSERKFVYMPTFGHKFNNRGETMDQPPYELHQRLGDYFAGKFRMAGHFEEEDAAAAYDQKPMATRNQLEPMAYVYEQQQQQQWRGGGGRGGGLQAADNNDYQLNESIHSVNRNGYSKMINQEEEEKGEEDDDKRSLQLTTTSLRDREHEKFFKHSTTVNNRLRSCLFFDPTCSYSAAFLH